MNTDKRHQYSWKLRLGFLFIKQHVNLMKINMKSVAVMIKPFSFILSMMLSFSAVAGTVQVLDPNVSF